MTTSTAAAPASSASSVSQTVSACDCEPVAATTGIRPRLVSTATLTSWARSSAVSVLGSAVVPQTTMP